MARFFDSLGEGSLRVTRRFKAKVAETGAGAWSPQRGRLSKRSSNGVGEGPLMSDDEDGAMHLGDGDGWTVLVALTI